MKRTITAVLLAAAILWISCDNPLNNGDGTKVERKNGRVVIIDRTGKRWDVTHAEQKYGLKGENFQFGLGPFAIQPIMNPNFLNPGDPRFPSPQSDFLVIGATLNGDIRAYPIEVLNFHEIANDRFGNAQVSIAY